MSTLDPTTRPGLGWEDALEAALQPDGPLRLAFQPIVDLRQGSVAGYEVLARFALDGRPASPLPWLRAAGEHGLLAKLERTVLERALEVRARLPSNAFLSVNLSAAVLLDLETSRVFSEAGDLRGLVIEITEHERVLDYDALRTAFAPTMAAGAVLGVDDAGSGYASLGHVLALRPAFVKLDRELVADLDHECHRAAAISAIGAMTSELDGWLVAEGIERAGELRALVALGVPLGQGYLLGRPAPRMERPPELLLEGLRRARRPRTGALRVGPMAEEVPTREVTPGEHEAISRLLQAARNGPAPRHVIVVDQHGVPVAIEEHGQLVPGLPRPMCVMPDEDIADVALRAAARPAAERLLPLVCCDELGRPLGIVAVDRLVAALGRTVPAPDGSDREA